MSVVSAWFVWSILLALGLFAATGLEGSLGAILGSNAGTVSGARPATRRAVRPRIEPRPRGPGRGGFRDPDRPSLGRPVWTGEARRGRLADLGYRARLA